MGFVLESGFKADDGSLDQNGDLFGREAHVDLYTPYGTLTFGVMPVFGSTLGANGSSARSTRSLRTTRKPSAPA